MANLNAPRLSLDELAAVMPIVEKRKLQQCFGCGDGTAGNPYTWGEAEALMDSGYWIGGYVLNVSGGGYGWVGPEAVVTPTSNPYVNAANYASSYLGLTDWSVINNFFYTTTYHNPPQGTPWCAAFVSYIFGAAGIGGAGSASVSAWSNWGSATSDPQIGDVAIWNNGDSHMGIVTAISGDSATVISGNYSGTVGYATKSIISNFLLFRTER